MATETEPQNHLLLRTIQGVLQGQADVQQLKQVLADSQASLAGEQEAFRHTMAGLDEEIRRAVEGPIASVEELFGQFGNALGLIEEYFKSQNQELLLSAGPLIDRIVSQLNSVQLELRNRALVAMGPTDIPNLNLLNKAHKDYREGKDADGRRFISMVEAEIFHGVSSIENIKHSPQTPEILAMQDALAAHVEGMKRLARAIAKGSKDMIGFELKKAELTFNDMRDKMGAAAASLRSEGPTKSPLVNAILSLTQDVLRGVIPDQALVNALRAQEQDLNQTRQAFEALASRPTDSTLITEEIERAREAFEVQEAALRLYGDFFADREEWTLKEAAEKLQRSAEALYLCHEQLQSIADREGKTLCLRCSHYNPSQRVRCEKCGAPLPALARDQATATFETAEGDPRGQQPARKGPMVSPNLVRLYKAVNAAAEGEITGEAFLKEIQWFEGVMESHAEYDVEEPDVSRLVGEEKVRAQETLRAIQDTEEMFRGGFADLQAGLDAFRRFPESGDKADLEEGLKLCDQGAHKLSLVQTATAGASS